MYDFRAFEVDDGVGRFEQLSRSAYDIQWRTASKRLVDVDQVVLFSLGMLPEDSLAVVEAAKVRLESVMDLVFVERSVVLKML